MKISDLICIGRLDLVQQESSKEKSIYLVLKPEYQFLASSLTNIFLIFKDHRVRYGTIEQQKLVSKKKTIVYFSDPDLREEINSEQRINIYLDEDGLNTLDEKNIKPNPIGMTVYWNENDVGIIRDFFYNGAHYVYEIAMTDNKNVLIPDVVDFVVETNITKNYIKVVNLDQFFL